LGSIPANGYFLFLFRNLPRLSEEAYRWFKQHDFVTSDGIRIVIDDAATPEFTLEKFVLNKEVLNEFHFSAYTPGFESLMKNDQPFTNMIYEMYKAYPN